MVKYKIKKSHENEVVCTEAPLYRNENGRFDLSKCTQRDLKYLHEVVKHPFIEIDEQKSAARAKK